MRTSAHPSREWLFPPDRRFWKRRPWPRGASAQTWPSPRASEPRRLRVPAAPLRGPGACAARRAVFAERAAPALSRGAPGVAGALPALQRRPRPDRDGDGGRRPRSASAARPRGRLVPVHGRGRPRPGRLGRARFWPGATRRTRRRVGPCGCCGAIPRRGACRPTSSPACGGRDRAGRLWAGGGLAVRVRTDAPCLLVVALNYAESLEAASASQRLRDVPGLRRAAGSRGPGRSRRDRGQAAALAADRDPRGGFGGTGPPRAGPAEDRLTRARGGPLRAQKRKIEPAPHLGLGQLGPGRADEAPRARAQKTLLSLSSTVKKPRTSTRRPKCAPR